MNSIFRFKPTSKLHSFVTSKTRINKSLFTLAEILTILKDAIRGEGLYDEKNPSIILCSRDLEEALNMKALHVTEIRDLVLNHLTKLESDEFLKRHCDSVTPAPAPNNPVSATQRLIQTANISTHVVTDKKAKFTCKPKFLAVLRTLPETDKNKLVFTYEEATLLLSTYILKHKNRFFDNRNIKLAMVKGDLLGEAFGVSAFHRCQVNNFLRDQLIPYSPDTCPDTPVVVSEGSPDCGASISVQEVTSTSHQQEVTNARGEVVAPANLADSTVGFTLPAFPVLSRATTLPAGSGMVRKRSDSECEDELRSKQARTLDTAHYITVKAGSLSDCETETIYSSQSRDTISIQNEDEDEDEEDDEFDDEIEYEPESGAETERPPQALGRQSRDGYTSDSDSEMDVDFKVMDKVKKEAKKEEEELWKESVYWGDNSDEEKELDSYDSELESADLWTCVTCKKPNKPYFRYCASCWIIRRDWVAQHDRKKKRKREPKKIKMIITPQRDFEDSGIGSDVSQELEITTVRDTKPTLERQESLSGWASSSSSSVPSLTSVAATAGSKVSSVTPHDPSYPSTSSVLATSHLCLLCCHRTRNASLVHGRMGHLVCCYPCAKKLWKKQADCPVCRRKVEKIIKIIPA